MIIAFGLRIQPWTSQGDSRSFVLYYFVLHGVTATGNIGVDEHEKYVAQHAEKQAEYGQDFD